MLETRTFRRVGGGSDITVDVRVIAATHRDLPKAVAEGRFREDLYFRLNVVPIVVPPLRERPEDVPLMAEHFIAQFCRELGRPAARLHPDALRVMLDYAWPGNVRELRNLMERVVLLEAEDEIRVEHLPPEVTGARGGARTPASAENVFPPGVVRPLAEVEKLAIEHALSVCGGNKTLAAKQPPDFVGLVAWQRPVYEKLDKLVDEVTDKHVRRSLYLPMGDWAVALGQVTDVVTGMQLILSSTGDYDNDSFYDRGAIGTTTSTWSTTRVGCGGIGARPVR